MRAYVETEVGANAGGHTRAWSFELPHWGVVGQGHDETSALAALADATGHRYHDIVVAERIAGDERAFARDRRPATPDELAFTRHLLARVRAETIRLVRAASPAELDWTDPGRRLPRWARLGTARELARHLADTESRRYLPGLGVPPPPPAPDIVAELHRSHAHVLAALATLEPDRYRGDGVCQWTTVKLLRCLAWHEPGELAVLRRLLVRARMFAR